uniref:Uncharacterized protein n=1 Tax=Plectus sambesii TaxID=2011161 RepID=A0A914UM65_9BILA
MRLALAFAAEPHTLSGHKTNESCDLFAGALGGGTCFSTKKATGFGRIAERAEALFLMKWPDGKAEERLSGRFGAVEDRAMPRPTTSRCHGPTPRDRRHVLVFDYLPPADAY